MIGGNNMKEIKKLLIKAVFNFSTAFTIFIALGFVGDWLLKPEIFKSFITALVCGVLSLLVTLKLEKMLGQNG
jgi:hypothetical protein